MRIEFGFQANCSVLVTYVCPMEKDQLIEVMDTLQDTFGGTWRLPIRVEKDHEEGEKRLRMLYDWYYLLIPREHYDDLIEYYDIENFKGFGIVPRNLIPLLKDLIPKKLKEAMIEHSENPRVPHWKYHGFTLWDIPPTDPVTMNSDESLKLPSPSMWFWDEDHRPDGWYYGQSDCNFEDYPMFNKIRSMFGLKPSCEGGCTAQYYIAWMVVHFTELCDEDVRLAIRNEFIDDPEERIDALIEEMLKYPPITKLDELPEWDVKRIMEMCLYGFEWERDKPQRLFEELSEMEVETFRSFVFDKDSPVTREDIFSFIFSDEDWVTMVQDENGHWRRATDED